MSSLIDRRSAGENIYHLFIDRTEYLDPFPKGIKKSQQDRHLLLNPIVYSYNANVEKKFIFRYLSVPLIDVSCNNLIDRTIEDNSINLSRQINF
jgi:hypothetical protein